MFKQVDYLVVTSKALQQIMFTSFFWESTFLIRCNNNAFDTNKFKVSWYKRLSKIFKNFTFIFKTNYAWWIKNLFNNKIF